MRQLAHDTHQINRQRKSFILSGGTAALSKQSPWIQTIWDLGRSIRTRDSRQRSVFPPLMFTPFAKLVPLALTVMDSATRVLFREPLWGTLVVKHKLPPSLLVFATGLLDGQVYSEFRYRLTIHERIL